MLKNTFLHIPGLGIKSEQRIWSSGIHSWDDLLREDLKCFSLKKANTLRRSIEESLEQLTRKNPNYFGSLLPTNQFWRFFPDFRESTAYLDIETTGLDSWSNTITTIALYDGESVFTYVQGQNLDDFKKDVKRFKVLVTYNGRCFDLPFIESTFDIKCDPLHIDLRYLLRSLGYTGGLKGCERKAGINREELDGLDGYSAVLLWNDYQRNKDPKSLETLLAYNIQDVVNLEILMVLSYNLKLKETPFVQSHQITSPEQPEIPFKADKRIIEGIKRMRSYDTVWQSTHF
jgi:uncharacterized protein